jgi:hypothetical protein
MRAENYQRRRQELAGWPAGIVSYRLDERFICEIDNVNRGARVARAEGATRGRPSAPPWRPPNAASPAPGCTRWSSPRPHRCWPGTRELIIPGMPASCPTASRANPSRFCASFTAPAAGRRSRWISGRSRRG